MLIAEFADRQEHPVLSIIIPAYNEEESIKSTLDRCLQARRRMLSELPLKDVEIIVVDDGSRDATANIVRRYEDITLLSLSDNQGYGAALKAGFQTAQGQYLAFLDADGTCDPESLIPLYRHLQERRAVMVIGSRLHGQSAMPYLRYIGNLLYVLLLGVMSRRYVADTASGVRIFYRDLLPILSPLPDGLNFSVALTAAVLFSPQRFEVAEQPIVYQERIGRSKLRLVKDGLRFLGALVQVGLSYRPARLLGLLGGLLAFIAGVYVLYPLEFYLRHGFVEEWMIYRFLFIAVLGFSSLMLFITGGLLQGVVDDFTGQPISDFYSRLLARAVNERILVMLSLLFLAGVLLLNWQGIVQYVQTGHVTIHWSRVVVGGFCGLSGVYLLCAALLKTVLRYVLKTSGSVKVIT